MPAGMEMSKSDQIRLIGEQICRFANGQPCLCIEKDRTLCNNVKATALEIWDLAHLTEMSRTQWNARSRFESGSGTDPKKPSKVKPAGR